MNINSILVYHYSLHLSRAYLEVGVCWTFMSSFLPAGFLGSPEADDICLRSPTLLIIYASTAMFMVCIDILLIYWFFYIFIFKMSKVLCVHTLQFNAHFSDI